MRMEYSSISLYMYVYVCEYLANAKTIAFGRVDGGFFGMTFRLLLLMLLFLLLLLLLLLLPLPTASDKYRLTYSYLTTVEGSLCDISSGQVIAKRLLAHLFHFGSTSARAASRAGFCRCFSRSLSGLEGRGGSAEVAGARDGVGRVEYVCCR
jgi:hypothetical protein